MDRDQIFEEFSDSGHIVEREDALFVLGIPRAIQRNFKLSVLIDPIEGSIVIDRRIGRTRNEEPAES